MRRRLQARAFQSQRAHRHILLCSTGTDCLVHGPLTATLLLNLMATAARGASGQVKSFEYRATSPLTVAQIVRLRGAWQDGSKKAASLWALNEAGTVCMTANATMF